MHACSALELRYAVGTALVDEDSGRPRADPGGRCQRTGLLPRVVASNRASGHGCVIRGGGSQRSSSFAMRVHGM